MGYGSWNSSAYSVQSAVRSVQSREQVFQKRDVSKEFDPRLVEVRESLDSEDSPESTALIFALDVTGSMGFIAEHIAKKGLGTLVQGILDTKPVSDPHIMMMGIGDINVDEAPLQVTQFEADNRISDQIVDIWLEGGGGGNDFESYDLAWLFAARKTKIDCFDKRGKKGYLFTIGDEEVPRISSSKVIEKMTGMKIGQKLEREDALAAAQEKFEVFHVIVEQGNHMGYARDKTVSGWKKLLGKRAILLDNYKCISEVILSVIRVNEGADPQTVIDSWQDKKAKESVKYALGL